MQNKTVMKKRNLVSLLLIFTLITLGVSSTIISLAAATTTVPTNTYLSMPLYNTNFNFNTEQTFNNLYMETNATYPNYWFMTLGTGETYGLQSADSNFTVSTLFSSQTLTYYPRSSGTVNIYCGSLGAPVSVTGAITASYNAATKVYSVLALGLTNVVVSWTVVPPTPTPTPPAPPTASLTINQPTNGFVASTSNILVSLTASGGTIDKVWFNVQNSSGWVYPTAIIYTAPYQLTGFGNGTYTLYAYCNNTVGSAASASRSFSVAIPSGGYTPLTPTVAIGRPQNITYITPSIYVSLSSTGADAVWYNIKNGTNWIYAANQTYTGATSKTGFSNGTYTFYAFAANSYGGIAQASVMFTIGANNTVILPVVNVDNFWLFFYEGNFLGFAQAYLVSVFYNLDTAIALIVMLFMVPIYLRTKSLMLLCVLWIMLGGFVIAAMPLASGIAILFIVLGIGGLIFRLFRNSSYT